MGVRTSVSPSGYLSSGLSTSRRGTCEEISGAYEKTSTNGKFLYRKPSKLSRRVPRGSALGGKDLSTSYALFLRRLSASLNAPPMFLRCSLGFLLLSSLALSSSLVHSRTSRTKGMWLHSEDSMKVSSALTVGLCSQLRRIC